MTQYPWKYKLSKWKIEWWQTDKTIGTDRYFHYIRIDTINKRMRSAWSKEDVSDHVWITRWSRGSIGFYKFWYDTIHVQLNLYFFCVSWSTPWSTVPKDFWK